MNLRTALLWLALLLIAYAVWQRGWFFTESTSRRRDLAGFVMLVLAAVVLSTFVTVGEVCIASQVIELGQSAVTTPVVCE